MNGPHRPRRGRVWIMPISAASAHANRLNLLIVFESGDVSMERNVFPGRDGANPL